jgi:tRNA A37 threonylcarbamoyltransferase TsaD
MNAAKTLAAALNKPIVGVHHMVRYTCTLVVYPLDTPFSKATP